ncbi:UNVERIFIED_CONTAM: PiggyBac transposable element-derived protein 3 [Trichonephila clavipes]
MSIAIFKQPNMIKVYNQFIGNVDRADEYIDKYQEANQSKKWYSSPVLFCFELVLQNAWQLCKTNGSFGVSSSRSMPIPRILWQSCRIWQERKTKWEM